MFQDFSRKGNIPINNVSPSVFNKKKKKDKQKLNLTKDILS